MASYFGVGRHVNIQYAMVEATKIFGRKLLKINIPNKQDTQKEKQNGQLRTFPKTGISAKTSLADSSLP